MPNFYTIASSGFDTPEATGIITDVSGITRQPPCPECGGLNKRLVGELVVKVSPKRGSRWFDTLEYVSYPVLIVSERVRETWRQEGIGEFPSGPVRITGRLPKRLEGVPAPQYFYLDGETLQGALLDLARSGFIIAKTCATCGRHVPDTEAVQPTFAEKYVFEDTWNGAHLFTTDKSPTSYYCTEPVVESIRRNGFTGFEIAPCSSSRRG